MSIMGGLWMHLDSSTRLCSDTLAVTGHSRGGLGDYANVCKLASIMLIKADVYLHIICPLDVRKDVPDRLRLLHSSRNSNAHENLPQSLMNGATHLLVPFRPPQPPGSPAPRTSGVSSRLLRVCCTLTPIAALTATAAFVCRLLRRSLVNHVCGSAPPVDTTDKDAGAVFGRSSCWACGSINKPPANL